jgi:hypothetical protein
MGRTSQQCDLQPRRRHRLRRAAVVAAGSLAVGVAVAACGGGPSTPGAASGSTATAPAGSCAAGKASCVEAFTSCMGSHGVPLPAPGTGGPNAEAHARTMINSHGAAYNACKHLLPAGRTSPTITVREQRDYLRAAACMRSHGIASFPDPTFSGGQVSFPIPSSIDTHSTRFAQARLTCEKLIPEGLPYSGSAG